MYEVNYICDKPSFFIVPFQYSKSARQKLLSVAQHEQISRVRRHICRFAFRSESTSCFYCVPSLPHPVSSPDPPQRISNNWIIIIQFDILNVDLSWWNTLCPRSTLHASRIMEVNNWPTTITKNWGAVLQRGMRRCLHHSSAQKLV